MEKFQSTKLIDGFSTCFRQWKAEDTHCKYLHGYAISFKVTFEGTLDYRNWVVDFGFMKRSKNGMELAKPNRFYDNDPEMRVVVKILYPQGWFNHMFDHTVIIAEDDPDLVSFMELEDMNLIRLRRLPKVGCEMFAKFVYEELNKFLYKETDDRVRVVSVECFEHAKNSAIYTNI